MASSVPFGPLGAAARTVAEKIVLAIDTGAPLSWSPTSSTSVELITYNPLTQNMTIKFRRKPITYDFPGTDVALVAKFVASRSKGRFFHQHLK